MVKSEVGRCFIKKGVIYPEYLYSISIPASLFLLTRTIFNYIWKTKGVTGPNFSFNLNPRLSYPDIHFQSCRITNQWLISPIICKLGGRKILNFSSQTGKTPLSTIYSFSFLLLFPQILATSSVKMGIRKSGGQNPGIPSHVTGHGL